MNWLMDSLGKVFGWPGFGYTPPPLQVNGEKLSGAEQLVDKANEVVRQVELLEWEIRREVTHDFL